jgi:hypothetical protein
MPLEFAPSPPALVRPTTIRLRAWLRQGGWRSLALGAGGALAGGAYAHLVGCRTGGCAILAGVGSATLAGALMGLVIGWPAPPRRGADGSPPRR